MKRPSTKYKCDGLRFVAPAARWRSNPFLITHQYASGSERDLQLRHEFMLASACILKRYLLIEGSRRDAGATNCKVAL